MGQHLAFNHTLAQITASILEAEDHIATISEATDQFFHLLMKITQLDPQNESLKEAHFLPSGKSLGPYWAAMCVKDLMRTKKFVRGLFCAIQAAQKRFPGTPIHVLYAGPGPFATLALPMTNVFTPAQLQFTFLEVNELSYQMLQKTIESFDLKLYVKEIIHTDATVYCPTQPVHILLSETMQNALDKEPQVAITQHLIPYLHPEGFLVPQSITIQAGLLNPANEYKRLQDFENPPEHYVRFLDVIFELNRFTALSFSEEFPEVEIEVTSTQSKDFPQLNLFTNIRVFEQEIITAWQTGLTLPKKIWHLDLLNRTHQKMSFKYQPGTNPGFEFRLLE